MKKNLLNLGSLKRKMIDYIKEIEKRLGAYNRLPDTPFISKCRYAAFPSLDDDLVSNILYKALFDANEELGNRYFLVKSFLDIKGGAISILKQRELNWPEFEKFQVSSLVYEGFYMTGENLNWLGIYHPHNYIVIGANDYLTSSVTNELYGNDDWQSKFEDAFNDNQLEMYESDYDSLRSKLFVAR